MGLGLWGLPLIPFACPYKAPSTLDIRLRPQHRPRTIVVLTQIPRTLDNAYLDNTWTIRVLFGAAV